VGDTALAILGDVALWLLPLPTNALLEIRTWVVILTREQIAYQKIIYSYDCWVIVVLKIFKVRRVLFDVL
jgi:hypothetical protein